MLDSDPEISCFFSQLVWLVNVISVGNPGNFFSKVLVTFWYIIVGSNDVGVSFQAQQNVHKYQLVILGGFSVPEFWLICV